MSTDGNNSRSTRRPRILFCSTHCYLDPSSGAALSVRDLFSLLVNRGWDCQVFCGSQTDLPQDQPQSRDLIQLLRDHQLSFVERKGETGKVPWSFLDFKQGDVLVRAYQSPYASPNPSGEEGFPFLALLERILDWTDPDVVLTYGGHWVARETIKAVKRRGIPVVFWLCNLAYLEADLFYGLAGVLVPSKFVGEHYRQSLGLHATAITCPQDWARCRCDSIERRYVTFVNPVVEKGAVWFAAIARELGLHRPDIAFLLVEGRGTAASLRELGIDLGAMTNVRVMGNIPDPREFYRLSRIVLMPSLWQEPFGRVAAEACINGIPVLASRRGGLPQVLTDAGFLFDLPEWYTTDFHQSPTPADIVPWVQTIIRLWDDTAFYTRESQRAFAAANAWRPEQLAEEYDAFLRNLMSPSSDAPPLVSGLVSPASANVEPSSPSPTIPAGAPLISVIMPVYNGSAFLDRAVHSVRRQGYSNWELLAVDDGSADDSYQRLCGHAASDARVRVLRLDKNAGEGAARNHGIEASRGQIIAYLDCDDEYYADYLENVAARLGRSDVLIFGYDLIDERVGTPGFGKTITHFPSLIRTELMKHNICTPLSVSHRRSILDKTGLFGTAAFEGDWDMWKRFAHARALFLFVNLKSGLYHIRANSMARKRTPTDGST